MLRIDSPQCLGKLPPQGRNLAFNGKCGRPYRKNDASYVEQKNRSIVRRFAGHARLEGEQTCVLLNELYGLLRDYNNFFLPSEKLVEKTRQGTKVKRVHDTPQTPCHRLPASPDPSDSDKRGLKEYYETLNPAELHRKILAVQKKFANKTKRALPSSRFLLCDNEGLSSRLFL